MSEQEAEHLGWLISIPGWEHSATRPKPYYAHTEAEKDWYLANSLEPATYDIERVPDPYTPEHRAALEAWAHAPEVGPLP